MLISPNCFQCQILKYTSVMNDQCLLKEILVHHRSECMARLDENPQEYKDYRDDYLLDCGISPITAAGIPTIVPAVTLLVQEAVEKALSFRSAIDLQTCIFAVSGT